MYHVAKENIRWWRHKFNLPPSLVKSIGSTKYTLNRNFFSSIDTQEKAYVLGFISADGYIHRNLRSISITLSEDDIAILEAIRMVTGSNAELHHRINKDAVKPQVTLSLCSKELIRDLLALGITPNKSLTVRYPPISDLMAPHFIRGVLDGDGWIGEHQCEIVGSKFLLIGIQDVIHRITGCMWSARPIGRVLKLQCNRRDRSSMLWIYKGATLKLERKYQRFLRYWN